MHKSSSPKRRMKSSETVTTDPTVYIDEIYKYDETQRKKMFQLEEKGDFLSGSIVEGAFICRCIMESCENFEADIMKPFGEISSLKSKHILTSTDQTDQIGYYRLRFNEELLSCLDIKFYELLKMNDGFETKYLGDKMMKLYTKMSESGSDPLTKGSYVQHEDGSPSVYSNIEVASFHIEIDTVLCIKLLFWPEIVHPWFKRKRNWPNSKIMNEVNLKKCHLVLKKSNEGGSNDQWRLSLSLAEGILSKDKSAFQKKCYLLAKFMYYAYLKQYTDEETGRHVSSYLLKTTMLHMLEETNSEDWKIWEIGKFYIKVVYKLFQRLAESLNVGFLPFFFVEEMNLLGGYSHAFLKEMAGRVRQVCEEWMISAGGEELFHTSIKSMYQYIISKTDMPENKSKNQKFGEKVFSVLSPPKNVKDLEDMFKDKKYQEYMQNYMKKLGMLVQNNRNGNPEDLFGNLNQFQKDRAYESYLNFNQTHAGTHPHIFRQNFNDSYDENIGSHTEKIFQRRRDEQLFPHGSTENCYGEDISKYVKKCEQEISRISTVHKEIIGQYSSNFLDQIPRTQIYGEMYPYNSKQRQEHLETSANRMYEHISTHVKHSTASMLEQFGLDPLDDDCSSFKTDIDSEMGDGEDNRILRLLNFNDFMEYATGHEQDVNSAQNKEKEKKDTSKNNRNCCTLI